MQFGVLQEHDGLAVADRAGLDHRQRFVQRHFEDFRRAVLKLPHVLECHLVSGDFDYLVKARINEMASYRKLLGDILLKLPHVRESKSYIVMEEVKESLALPVPE